MITQKEKLCSITTKPQVLKLNIKNIHKIYIIYIIHNIHQMYIKYTEWLIYMKQIIVIFSEIIISVSELLSERNYRLDTK